MGEETITKKPCKINVDSFRSLNGDVELAVTDKAVWARTSHLLARMATFPDIWDGNVMISNNRKESDWCNVSRDDLARAIELMKLLSANEEWEKGLAYLHLKNGVLVARSGVRGIGEGPREIEVENYQGEFLYKILPDQYLKALIAADSHRIRLEVAGNGLLLVADKIISGIAGLHIAGGEITW